MIRRETVIGILALALGCSRTVPASGEVPSDAEIRRRFAAHRAQFEELRELLLSEPTARLVGVDRIDECYLRSGAWSCSGARADEVEVLRRAGLAAPRIQRYRELLAQVGSTCVQRVGTDVELVLFAGGIVTSGVTKGVRWSSGAIPSLVPDTDAPSSGFEIRNAALDGPWTIERTSN